MNIKLIAASAAIIAALGVSTVASAGTIIAPTSVVINNGGPGFGSIGNTIDQSGLSVGYTSGVTDFDTYIGTNPTHTTTFNGFEWFSNSGTTSAQVTYNFGSLVTIDRLALWNEESSGIGQLVLDGDSNPGFLNVFPFDNSLVAGNYSAQVFSFSPITTQYITFKMSGCPQANPGTFPGCAIGEVAFRTAMNGGGIPEPTTWALMIGGFGMAGAMLRRRRFASAT